MRRLLEKNMPMEFRHIRKLSKDTCTISDESVTTEGGTAATEDQKEKIYLQCAISQKVVNGISKFVASWSNGCIYSELGLKMLKDQDQHHTTKNQL